MKKMRMVVLCAGWLLLAVGCRSYHSADVYRADELGYEARVDEGVVLSVREVVLKQGDSFVGTAVGAVAGGVAGSYAGEGRGQVIGASVGTVVGGILGSTTQKLLEQGRGWEILVRRYRDSEEVIVVQQSEKPLQVGQVVRIIRDSGRSRVVPLNHTSRLELHGDVEQGL